MGKKESLKNYMTKIHTFVSCIQSDKWIKKAGEEDINVIFEIANDIEETIKKLNSNVFNEKLLRLYPDIDLSRSPELILEIILKCPYSKNNIVIESIKEFMKYHSIHYLRETLCKFLSEKKLKDDLITLHQELQINNTSDLKKLEAKATFSLWEEYLALGNDNLRRVMIDMLNTKTFDLLLIIDLNPVCRSNEKIICMMLDYINSENKVKHWSKVLDERNLDVVVNLCDKYSVFLDSVLNFFKAFENEVLEDYDEDLNIRWIQNDLEFEKFVKIIQRFLKTDGKVRDKTDEFLIAKRNDFDSNFSFWAEVSGLAY